MKRVRNCERCWLEYKKPTPADLNIDDRDLCFGCVEAEELDPADGERIVPPIASPEPSTDDQDAKSMSRTIDKQQSAVSVTPAKDVVEAARPRPSRAKQRAAKICEGCGEEFTPKQYRSRFCSTACQDRIWHRKQQSKSDKPVRACLGRDCGKQFVAKRKDQRFCSPECRNSARYPEADAKQHTLPCRAFQSDTGSSVTATITVTEERLNHFLVTLPIQQKAEIVSQYLGRN